MANIFLFLSFLPFILALDDNINVYNSDDTCKTECHLKFEDQKKIDSCARGCRLFSLADTIEPYREENATRIACASSCEEAYADNDFRLACVYGCNSEKPFFSANEKRLMNEVDSLFQTPLLDMNFFSPFLYQRDSFGNVVDKMHQRSKVSFSYYLQNADGKLVVVRSNPSSIEETGSMTQNYIETNLEPLDNSATPDIRNEAVFAERPEVEDLNLSQQAGSSDWLSCISSKTGLPRVILTSAIFLSALGMLWLAISTTVTASEQRVSTKKSEKSLSKYGDLDYLMSLEQPTVFTKVIPLSVEEIEAPALPLKMKIDQL